MKKKLFILLVVTVLLFGLTPVQAIIPGEDAYQPGNEITSTGVLFSDIPETLSPAVIEEAGHIARLRDQEINKNTAVFQNADGTNTLYFFAQDIWYETPQGQKLDYSTEIELQPNGTYIGNSNNKTLVLPQKASQGFTYTENGYTINMVPSMDTVISTPIVYEQTEALPEEAEEPVELPYSLMNTNSISVYEPDSIENIVDGLVLDRPAQLQSILNEESGREKNSVLYENIYSSNTDIETVPLLHGVRQSIPVTDNSKTSFSFKMSFNGLTPQNSTGCSIALANAAGKIEGHITADYSDIYCPYTLDIASYNNGEYLVTVTLDEEYIANSTQGINEEIQLNTIIGDDYIYDTYVNSGKASTNYNSSTKLYCGYYNTGTCRTYVRFLLGSAFENIDPDLITTESFYMYVVNGTNAASVKPNIPNLIWDNSTLTWNTSVSVSPAYTTSRNGVTAPSATSLPNSTGFKAINLKTSGAGTGLMAAFIRDNIDPSLNATLDQSRGVAIVNTTNNDDSLYTKTFYSANNGSNLPYVSVSYNVAVTGISVSPASATLTVKGTKQLTREIFPSNATNQNVTWTTSKSSVATVSASGKVTAKAVGTATITAKTADGNKTDTCIITVKPPVNGVSVTPEAVSVRENKTKQLTADVSPSEALNKNVTWTSSNTAIATVNSSGVVTGKAFGNATITATTKDGGYTDTCAVRVYPETYTVLTYNSEYEDSISSGEVKWYRFNPTEDKAYDILSTGSTDVKATLYRQAKSPISDNNSGEGTNFLICREFDEGFAYFLKVQCGSTSSPGGAFKIKVRDNYGAALPYVQSAGNVQNCFGYAINEDMYIVTPEQYAGVSTEYKEHTFRDIGATDTATSYFPEIQQFISSKTDSFATLINSKTDFVDNDSYRIAMRITHGATWETTSGELSWPADYHFFKQTNTGEWSHKQGDALSYPITNDPDTNCLEWLFGHDMDGVSYYYDSPTIYFSLRYQ